MAWRPGQRKAQRALEDPYEDVPTHLRQPLWDWIVDGFAAPYGYKRDRLQEIAIDLRIPLYVEDPIKGLWDRCRQDDEFMLDLVEAMLERYGSDSGRAWNLQNVLVAANSAYVVNQSSDGLEQRVAPGVKELVREAVDAAGGSAGDHPANAWNAAYGRTADPAKAYSEAIKAAEAALAQRVSPQNSKQTLGTMIKDVSAKPSKWRFAIDDPRASGVETVLNMMRTLWHGQTSRHGGLNVTRAETSDEAKAAMHLAAALVQFGVSGAFELV